MEPFERTHSGKTDKYPLHLQSCHPDKRLHSQLCSSEAFHNTCVVRDEERFYPQAVSLIVRVMREDEQYLESLLMDDFYFSSQR